MTQPEDPAVPPSAQPKDRARAGAEAPASALEQNVVDIDLAMRIERALHAIGYAPLRAIQVAVCAGVVNLQGQVSSFYMKQLAQAVALAVPGVQHLRNDLNVIVPGGHDERLAPSDDDLAK
jgi:osmotically-inducible protein OsmY